MSRLPRPDLPSGPHRDLIDALHVLHHSAGWPSLRTLAAGAGCSHTTVSKAFSSAALPSWGTLELLVENMGGDNELFHDLWLSASTPAAALATPDRTTSGSDPIAGRRTELAVVGQHLDTGSGLLLVAGEAGVGKSRLVETAGRAAAVQVLHGSCLPLSSDAPLLPVAQVMREAHAADGGQWVASVLSDLPAYMTGSLARLLPELAPLVTVEQPDDDQSRQRLFASVAALLTALAQRRPLAVVLEDLHWADSATLDLLEHLVARGPRVAVVGTWRLDDTDTAADRVHWWTRVRRSSAVSVLELSALTRDETAAQLRLLWGCEVDEDRVDEVYRLGRGHPLFTELLAARGPDEDAWPRLLIEVLDRRLEGLQGETWKVARLLGVADRALPADLLASASALTMEAMVGALRDLGHRRLLGAPGRDEVALGHPLLAEAIRRRLMPGEAVSLHRQLATALASSAHPEAAEVAGHWQKAGQDTDELTWRIAAARVAESRFSNTMAADHWIRALALWPEALPVAGVPPLRRYAAYAAAMDCCELSGRREESEKLARQALDEPSISTPDRADALRRVGHCLSVRAGAGSGLAHLEQAVALYRDQPPSEGLMRALDHKAVELTLMGRRQEGAEAIDEAVRVGRSMDTETPLLRGLLAHRAWHDAVEGRMAQALDGMNDAESRPSQLSEPKRDLSVAVMHTDILLMACAPAAEVQSAARPALEAAARWAVVSESLDVLRVNLSIAWQREGEIDQARRMLVLGTDSGSVPAGTFMTIQRAGLDVADGDLEAARKALESLPTLKRVGDRSLIELKWARWEMARGDLEGARDRLFCLLTDAQSAVADGEMGETLAWTARAGVDSCRGDLAQGSAAAANLNRLRAAITRDPFRPPRVPADACWAGVWDAELARATSDDTVEQWAGVALALDKVRRRHDAAYCRWRAAQCAIRGGQGTAATRLLKQATAEAREYVPLRRAIEATERAR